MVVLLIEVGDNKGSGCNEGNAEFSFRCVNFEMGITLICWKCPVCTTNT